MGRVRPRRPVDRGVRAATARSTVGAAIARRDPRRGLRARLRRALGTFVQSYGSSELDASLLLIPLVGFLPADDPRVQGTVEAIERDARPATASSMRYRHARDRRSTACRPARARSSPCSFWLVDCYALLGRHDEAHALFERLLALAQRRRAARRGVRPARRSACSATSRRRSRTSRSSTRRSTCCRICRRRCTGGMRSPGLSDDRSGARPGVSRARRRPRSARGRAGRARRPPARERSGCGRHARNALGRAAGARRE